MSVDYSNGYTSFWRVVSVDPMSWDDRDTLEGVESVSISKSADENVPMLETGSITLTIDNDEIFESGWYRIEMLAVQEDEHEMHPLATLYFQAPSATHRYSYQEVSINGESVLKPASDRKFAIGSYAPKNTDIVQYIVGLLEDTCLAPVYSEGSKSISRNVVYDSGTSYLDAIWSLLDAIEYVMQIDGDGTIHVIPKPQEVERTFTSVDAAILGTEITESFDLSDIPNVVEVINGNDRVRVENDDHDSEISTFSRGFEKTEVETDPAMDSGYTLQSYAESLLESKSTLIREYSYTRDYIPGDDGEETAPFSIVRATLSNVGFEGDLRVVKQDYNCGKGITINETACEEVKLWTKNDL